MEARKRKHGRMDTKGKRLALSYFGTRFCENTENPQETKNEIELHPCYPKAVDLMESFDGHDIKKIGKKLAFQTGLVDSTELVFIEEGKKNIWVHISSNDRKMIFHEMDNNSIAIWW